MVFNYTGMAQLKHVKYSLPKDKGGVAPANVASDAKYTPVPMFLPVETRGENIATVVTREKFIKDNIKIWLEWRFSKVFTVVFGVAALVALAYNGILAASFGLAAGFCYGRHMWRNFMINELLKKRKLLEST